MFGEHESCLFQNENNVVLNENSVEGKSCIIEKVRALRSQFSYTVIMMNMNLLEVVTPPSIYNGCSTRKNFWEEKFTGEEKFFSAVKMKNCGRCNVRKHKDIKGSDNYVTLDISLKFDNLDNMKIKYS